MSEVMFFAAWFWSFFKHAIYPMNEYVGSEYVPPEIYNVDPFHLPLINTLVLLLSGCAVTWAHHALVHENNKKDMQTGLLLAIVLADHLLRHRAQNAQVTPPLAPIPPSVP